MQITGDKMDGRRRLGDAPAGDGLLVRFGLRTAVEAGIETGVGPGDGTRERAWEGVLGGVGEREPASKRATERATDLATLCSKFRIASVIPAILGCGGVDVIAGVTKGRATVGEGSGVGGS